jgi:hypothetical protein
MARRRPVEPVSAGRDGAPLPEDVIRYRVDVRGGRSGESMTRWLLDRAAWRQEHPDEPLPLVDSLTRHALYRLAESGQLDRELYAAEQSAPVKRLHGAA